MKKLILLLLAITSANFCAFGQTNVILDTGKVGIGTLSPVSLFSVGSSSQFQVNTSGLVSITNTAPEHRFVTLDGNYARFLRSTASSNNLFQGKNNVLQVGGIGKCLMFSGGAYLQGSDAGMPTGLPVFSISRWFKDPGQGASNRLLLKYGGAGSSGIEIFVRFNNVILITDGSGGNTYTTNAILVPASQWNHIVICVNGTALTMYINNISATGTLPYTPSITLAGSTGYEMGLSSDGYIDQVLDYNVILNSSQVSAIYNGGVGTSTPPTTGLIRRYDFEEGTGTTAGDTNPNGTQYPLTLFNSPTWSTGIVPTSSSAVEATFFSSSDGISNSEKGIATWGDFNGRNQQQGKWFQWFQGANYPLVSNNAGQWLFNPVNTSASLPTVASTIDIAGNVTIGSTYAGTNAAPANGLLVQGNLGIGTAATTVASKLHVLTTAIGLTQANTTGIYLQNNTAATAALTQYSPGLVFEGQGWKTTATAGSQAVDFREFVVPVQGTSNPTGYLSWGSSVNGGAYADGQMVLTSGGSLAIGTTDPKGYKLAVNGSAVATSMTVKLQANWPDYVFKPAYHLPALSEVKTYIDQNQHLPEMPSSDQVEKDGLNLGEIVKLQTKKIEELTLYLIQQKEETERQNKVQQQQIDELKKQLDTLTKALNKE